MRPIRHPNGNPRATTPRSDRVGDLVLRHFAHTWCSAPLLFHSLTMKRMSIPEFQAQALSSALDAFLNRCRPPAHVRSQWDVGAKIDGRSVEVFEVRAQWDSPGRTYRYPLAKATWNTRVCAWRIYCQDADLRWQDYPPKKTVDSILEFFEEVAADQHGCFFG